MERQDGINETKFRLLKALLDTLRSTNDITDKELESLLLSAVDLYQPLIGELEMNRIAREKGYNG